MLISNKFLYFQLHKTGSSFTKKVLVNLIKDIKVTKPHTRIDFKNKEDLLHGFENKMKVGNVRNPWDWYVSLWAYGCLKKGGLYKKMTTKERLTIAKLPQTIKTYLKTGVKHKNSTLWENLYSDYSNKDNFRLWLKLILQKQNNTLGEGYIESPISTTVGLFTYRYLNLYCYNGIDDIKNERDYQKIEMFNEKNNFIEIVFKMESLNQDLIDNYSIFGIELEELQKALAGSAKNESPRNNYRDYYDKGSQELVNEKDKLIIEKYDYSF